MEFRSNISQEPGRPATDRITAGPEAGSRAAAVTQRAQEKDTEANTAQQGYEQAKQAVAKAYEKTAGTITETYDQAVKYGRANPGKLTLIAFGAGVGVGVLIATGFSSRPSRTSRLIQPVVGALSEIAFEMFR
ncbi:MAG TPA: hypothetical protein VFV34_11755 [Blastocatellia bacterium]|nr:hypothetical protein [Blastocatellia bacterium]